MTGNINGFRFSALFLLAAAISAGAAPQTVAQERTCGDKEAAEVQGVIRWVSPNRRFFDVKRPVKGTCDIWDVAYGQGLPSECQADSKFTAKGKTLSGLTFRLIADSVICQRSP